MNSTIRLYIRSWHFWVVIVLLILGVIFHYPQELPVVGGHLPKSLFHLERHSAERLIFLAAIVYGGLMLGMRTGLVIAVVSLAAMVPRLWLSAAPADAGVEMVFTVVVGVVVIAMFNAYQNQKRIYERTVSQLQAVQGQLQAKLQASERGAGEPARAAAEPGGDAARGLAALSREIKGLAASTGSRLEGVSEQIEKLRERVDQALGGTGRSK